MKISYIKYLGLVAVLATLITLGGCKEEHIKSLSELKEEQSVAVRTLIEQKHYRVVDLGSSGRLPEDPDPEVYYRIPSAGGLYMRVLDKGNMTHRAIDKETKIFVSFKGHSFNKEYPIIGMFDNLSRPSYPPVEFLYTYYYQYGEKHFTLLRQSVPIANHDDLMCQGLAYPMSLLGDGAKVSLIIPFEVGPENSYASGYTYFIEEAQYSFSNAK